MKLSIKSLAILLPLIFGLSFGVYKMAFSSACCGSSEDGTSGCSPSACRGAKTKFGEAQVISDLRLDLIALKSDMEQSSSPEFEARSYDIHDIIGDNDDESLEIIIREVKVVENAFVEKLDYNSTEFVLPDNKAKQIQYLSSRIESLHEAL